MDHCRGLLVLALLVGCGDRVSVAEDGGEGEETGGERPDLPRPDLLPPEPLDCEFDPPTVAVEVLDAEGPVPSAAGRLFWDPAVERLILFGGLRGSGDYHDWVVELDAADASAELLTWNGTPTFEMTSVSAAKDPDERRWFFVGGNHGQGLETEVLEVVAEGPLLEARSLPPLPTEVVDHGVGFDPRGGRLVYTGGWDGVPPDTDYRDETWELFPREPGAQWHQLDEAGGPPGQRDTELVHVPTLGLLLLASFEEGGEDAGLWWLASDEDVWVPLPLSAPIARHGRARLFWDEARCAVILWDEAPTWEDAPPPRAWAIDPFADPLTVVPIERPIPHDAHGRSAGYDPRLGRILDYGGADHDTIPSDYVQTVRVLQLD